jgi:ABC-type sugar transport system permease subunit
MSLRARSTALPMVRARARRRRARRITDRVLIPLGLLSPALALLAFIYGYPLVRLAQLSFERVITYQRTQPVGLDNYTFVVDDPAFRQALTNNLRLMIAVPVLVLASAVIASALREQWRGWRIQRSLGFLPYVLPIPAIGIAFSQILRSDGLLNGALDGAHLGFLAQDWIGSTHIAIWTVLAVVVWKELGFGSTLCLARLQMVDEELYEAARIDGAGFWRQLRHIGTPQLREVLGFYVVLETVTMLSWVFPYVFTLTGGGPAGTTSVAELYLYQAMFGYGSGGQDIGAAAAAGVLVLMGVLGLLVLGASLRAVAGLVRR